MQATKPGTKVLVFGGTICGHYEHQCNIIEGRIVDLSRDAIDVGRITYPYLHKPDFFTIPEKQASLNGCLLRVERWVAQFLEEIKGSEVPAYLEVDLQA